MKKVVLSGLTKDFGNIRAVDEINLTIDPGELFVVIGPTGSGKTTLLKLIAGLENPTAGKIYFDGELINDTSPPKRGVRMVFEQSSLFPHMKVYDEQQYSNLSFPLRVRNSGIETVKRRVARLATKLGLSSKLFDRKPDQLSEGQQEQVAIGKALTVPPEVLLLDEPLRDLDPSSKIDARSELLQLREELQATILYVTHDIREAFALADRLGIMKKGHLEQTGAVEDIKTNPRNQFVASFLENYDRRVEDIVREG